MNEIILINLASHYQDELTQVTCAELPAPKSKKKKGMNRDANYGLCEFRIADT